MRLEAKANSSINTFGTQEMQVGPAPELNLAMLRIDVLNDNEGKDDEEILASFLPNFAGTVATSKVRLGVFPARLNLPTVVVGGPAADPVVMNKRLCEGGLDPSTDECQEVGGLGGMDVAAVHWQFFAG